MAVNKRKVLDAARKYAQKGAKEKALKEYHTLLKLDPRDAKLHLEIGDCYRRWGQIDEAVTQYARVADQYKDDGFDARAVAVFKQILNLDPKRYAAFVSLSELYQRMGLDAEALTALQTAADGHHKEGNKREALELLRRMATLDPTNTTSRLKVAELLRQEGMQDDAASEYQEVVNELERQGATESIIAVQERILELQPGRVDVLLSIGRRLVELGKPQRAEPFAKQVLEKDSDDADAHELLVEVYKSLGKDEELAATTRTLAKIFRDRGDDDRARELTQRIPLALELEAEQASQARVEESESAFLSDEELLDDDFLAADQSEVADVSEELPFEPDEDLELEVDDDEPPEDDLDLALADEPQIDISDDDPVVEEPANLPASDAPEGDPDQLLAEASVYLRYGKRDQAIASLQAILAQEPEHRAALEKLGEAYAEGGDEGLAVVFWTRAAKCASAGGDADGFSVLRDRIAALDADAASVLDETAPKSAVAEDLDAEGGADEEESVGGDDDFEIDVSVGGEEDADAGIEFDLSTDDADAFAEPDTDLGLNQTEETLPVLEEEPEEIEVDIDVDIDVDEDEEVDDETDDEPDEVEEEAAADEASSSGTAGSSTTTSQQVSEDLEEAEFYYQQKLYDEAEAIYRRVLKVAPSHPSALLRLGELAAAKGDDPSAPEPEKAAAKTEKAVKKKTKKKSPAPAPKARKAEASIPAPGEDSTEVAELSGADDELAVHIDVPPADFSRADDTLPFEEEVAEEEPEDEEVESTVEEAEPLAVSDAGEEGEEGGFDLAAELRDVIEDEDEDDAADSGSLSTVEDGFESIFADFKQGVSETLSEDDYETRYDLGIAYREMELYDDAIGEFRRCLDSSNRRLASLHMMGLCALDLGRPQDAVNHLEQALATPDLPEEQMAGLHFDLGRALEVLGDVARARSAYETVLQADAEFPGVAERLESLGESGAGDAPVELQADASDGFESFEDIMSDSDDDDTTEQTEAFESFDDVITDAESAIASPGESVAEAEEIVPAEEILEIEPAEEPEPEKPTGKKKSRRKKKISFV